MNQKDLSYRPVFRKAFLLPQYWPTWCLLASMRLCVMLPRSLVGFIGARIGDVFYYLSPKRRHIAEINLKLAFPQWQQAHRSRVLRDHFRTYVQCLVDYGLLWWGSKSFLKKYIRIKGMERITREQDAGHNLILLHGHFSALDLGGSLVSEQTPFITMAKPAKNKLIDWYMAQGRRRFHVRVFVRKRGIRPVVREILQKKIFYYLPDEDFGQKQQSVFAPFLGSETATLTAVSRLARMAKARVLPCYTRRLPANAGYEVVVLPPMAPFPSDDAVADATLVNQAVEVGILQVPEQYMWTLRMFKSRSGGGASPYNY